MNGIGRRILLAGIIVLMILPVVLAGCAVSGGAGSGGGPLPSAPATPAATAPPAGRAGSPAHPVASVLRAVVEVQAIASHRGAVQDIAIGTGVLYDTRGTIVTANHVISFEGAAPAGQISVVLPDGRIQPAHVLARVPARDIAFVATRPYQARPARFASSYTSLSSGTQVFAVGAPRQFRHPVARGRIVTVRRDIRLSDLPQLTSILETTAQLRRGFSGGPVADQTGRIVGMNVAVTEGPPGPRTVGVAVPAPLVVESARKVLPGTR